MSEDLMNYQSLVESAMKGVVREVLLKVERDGLAGSHHLYITFRMQHAGVRVTERLAAQYPDEMTIVLQHQFWGLEITDVGFQITLSFSGRNEQLNVPFDAIVGFADPSVNFGLQFQTTISEVLDTEPSDLLEPDIKQYLGEDRGKQSGVSFDGDPAETEQKTGEVVALDTFRKKKT